MPNKVPDLRFCCRAPVSRRGKAEQPAKLKVILTCAYSPDSVQGAVDSRKPSCNSVNPMFSARLMGLIQAVCPAN